MSPANDGKNTRRSFLLGLVASTSCGCAHWLPSRKEPEPRKPTILSQELAPDTVGIESILLRLSSVESQQMQDLWTYADEQVIAPEPRMLLDRNGLRAGKFSGQIPAIVQAWVAQNATRIEQDPMEQAGVVADVSSFSQLWRCRPDQRKVLTVRNLPKETVTLFYNEEGFRGGQFPAPHFLFSLYAKPNGPQSAQVLLRPELEYGQTRRSVVAKDSAIRTEERRESLRWESLSLMLNMQRGDCLMITATAEPRGIGEHFFRTRSKEGEIQDVILLVRVAELNTPDEFSVASNSSSSLR
ncbi:MAG: hypothetical protein NTV29_11225 [Planctomycetota bacterium]|nr:hypothetical protein [Planctomycetota bacterium]